MAEIQLSALTNLAQSYIAKNYAAALIDKTKSAELRAYIAKYLYDTGYTVNEYGQEELIEHVWDSSVDSFSGSIRVHMSSLRKKLKAGLGYDPIVNKIGEGYKIGGNSKA